MSAVRLQVEKGSCVHIVLGEQGSWRDVELQLDDPTLCVDDFVQAVTATPATQPRIVVDGTEFGADVGLDEIGLYEGAVVRVLADPADDPDPGAPPPRADPWLPPHEGLQLAVVGGPCAGRVLPVADRPVRIGRAADCDLRIDDPTVSGHHLAVEPRAAGDGGLTVRDLGSHNGAWVDGEGLREPREIGEGTVVQLGASTVHLRREPTGDRPVGVDPLRRSDDGLVPFNRPPRPALPEPPGPAKAPKRPQPSKANRAFSVITIIAPLVMGGLLVWWTGNPRFALFLLLSPILGLGRWLSGRRQAKKENREGSRKFREQLERFEARLRQRRADELARRQARLPDLAEVCRRARQPSTALWARRADHDDFLELRAGIGTVAWEPPVTADEEDEEEEALVTEVREVVERCAGLPRAPVAVDLSDGGVVGIVGDHDAALGLARSLVVQAAVHHGPADLALMVLTSPARGGAWDWAKWLPHVRALEGVGGLRLAADPESCQRLLAGLVDDEAGARRTASRSRQEEPRGPTTLLVVDDVTLLEGRRAAARLALRGEGGPTAGIVLAASADQLPAVTTTVICLDSDVGDGELVQPARGERVTDLLAAGLPELAARDVARHLARYEDPELEQPGAGLPSSVRLLPLLGLDDVDEQMVTRSWQRGLPAPSLSCPIGVGEDGAVELDLVRDGPHGLIGGTTGSGKSELLRSLVAGLAARADPDHLNFVLVDYKGGSAFDRCAELPHTVGLVTDLDAHLGQRALMSLEAELRTREHVLRDAGCADLPEYLSAGAPLGPLPRLLVVIDEFATLAGELPDFLGALVGVAQRGRSLGVHLLLATQRPSGAVNANIKANTNLRIALRVQDDNDSLDIIDQTDAARIARSNPGRAYVRLGPSDVVVVQTPLSTAAASVRQRKVRLRPFAVDRDAVEPSDEPDGQPLDSDLARLVTAVDGAFTAGGFAPPRRPWQPMIAEHVDLDDVLVRHDLGDDAAPLGLVDEPERQRHRPLEWQPGQGHLAVYGAVGSGTSTALRTVVRALAERRSPESVHVYGLDFGAGGLAGLEHLPHVGGVFDASRTEEHLRLLRMLRAEVDRRRSLDAAALSGEPEVVVVVDGLPALLAEYDTAAQSRAQADLRRLFGEGSGVGVVVAYCADRPGALAGRYASLASIRLVGRLSDTNEYAQMGLRARDVPDLPPGRVLVGERAHVAQVAHPGTGLEDVGARLRRHWGEPAGGPRPVPRLPELVSLDELPPATVHPPPLRIPVGLREEDLQPAALELHPGEHAIVAGAPRSGKTELLLLIAQQLRAADSGAGLVALCEEQSLLFAAEPFDVCGQLAEPEIVEVVAVARADQARRWVLFVDDAPRVPDQDELLATLARSGLSHLHIVAAGRSSELRGSGLGHWTKRLKQSSAGVLLQPDPARDGEVFGLRLSKEVPVAMTVGRGYLVAHGEATLFQTARPAQQHADALAADA